MLKTILVPLDGSKPGELALVYAKELAIGLGAEIRLVCAPERREEETRRACSFYLEEIRERLHGNTQKANPAVDVRIVLVEGEPASGIVDYAEKEQIGLIVLASHGHSGILRWPLGSIASKIIQHSPVPVLMVRASEDLLKKPPAGRVFKKILLPLDGSPLGEAALPLTIEIAQALGSEVVLFRAVDIQLHIHSIGGPDHFRYTEQQVEQMNKDAAAYLDGTRKKYPVIKIRTLLATGDAASEILKAAEAENVSLVAMSSHGHTGIDRWVLGSISNKILHAGKEPLLIVRTQKT